jgi:hypothetical protein
MALTSPRFAPEDRLQEVASNSPPMRVGERSRGVHLIQNALLDLGYEMPVTTSLEIVDPDGQFGRETERTVRALQEAHGLTVDGVVGRQTMRLLDGFFPRHSHRVRLHMKAAASNNDPICYVPFDSAMEATKRVFGRYGIRVDYGSSESLVLTPEEMETFHRIDADCEWEVTEGEMYELHRMGSPVPDGEIVVYFVHRLVRDSLRGCGGHAPDRPACTVIIGAGLWTTAHEVGHVLLTRNFRPVHERHPQNLMARGGYSLPGIPMLTRAQVAQMKEHPACHALPGVPMHEAPRTFSPASQF